MCAQNWIWADIKGGGDVKEMEICDLEEYDTQGLFLADGVPRKLAILGSTLFLSFVNYTGLTIVGYVGVALGVISLGVALGVKNQQLKQLAASSWTITSNSWFFNLFIYLECT
ncbi:hypothetical protein K7X08_029206 [Anisodus acutangulus]|uniref:Uncharacterized protein n=1 Tax=Anisodus acutangulus TaxID=402998 RepID=A0A9Q1QTY0_9SOLA|nr:hypothetical protein K7X08_029206 [Anisodus acutangulus]